MKKSNAKEKICGLDSYAALAVLTVAACWFFAGRYGVFGANMDWISPVSYTHLSIYICQYSKESLIPQDI